MKKIIISILCFVAFNVSNAQTNQYKKAIVIVTADKTDYRLTQTETLSFQAQGQPLETQPSIFIDPSKTFQTFIGIGGALTDASAETFYKLPEAKQKELLKAYFSKTDGIGYTIGRTNMNSCDFSSESYTCVKKNDTELKSFDIKKDEEFKIPFIKEAINASNGDLKLFISPWSPPAWMKDNNDMLHGGKLLPEYFQSWANYYVKYIQALESQGIPVWGLTVQNEPMAKQTWESCIYTANEERDFIKNYLGPTLWKNGMKSKNLIGWDHNRDMVYYRAAAILEDTAAAKYVWGIGFHWYESWTGAPMYNNVGIVHEAFPETKLLLTEACNFPFSWKTIDDWNWGENYGASMINDFNNGAVAWTDWNILLDEKGGPNHVKNYCFAPIVADTRDGSLHYMNSYYYIGHFSKYIQPGAKRIACSSGRAQLLATAFQNPDGSIVVVVMNQGKEKFDYRLYDGGQAVETTSLPHSIMTLLIN